MTTKNPRVAAYIQPDTHSRLRDYMTANNLTESKAIDVILGEFFGVEVPRVTIGVLPSSLPSDVDDRLMALERVDVVELVQDAIAPLRSQLEALREELGEYAA